MLYINSISGFLLLMTIMGFTLFLRKQKLNNAERELAERLKSEEKLSQLNAELQTVNQELEGFSYSVSHDLRAPLRHLTGFAELLQKNKHANLDETAQRHLSYISSAASQMGQLIDALLAFSRVGRTELHQRTLDLNTLVQEVINSLLPETHGRNIVWQIAPLPVVNADLNLLRAVLTNLFSNALKFTRPRDVAKIEMGYTDNERETVFFIRDNGVGFEMQYVEKLFGVFQRLHTSEQFEGNGIGLANVRRIIQRHGGRAWAESLLNEETTFYFSLPKKKLRAQ
jgi:light-regulated signal transduction histidine kinase (bacteriophytochrome)